MPSLYARVFLRILDSSIAEDWRVRHVFEDFFKLSDRFGVVDMTHSAVARRLNVPEEIVRESITKLESPDPSSRNPEKEGRRIERLSEHRDWGWRIVNWGEYEAIRDRVSANERLIRHRDRKKKEAKLEPETAKKTETNGAAHSEFIALWVNRFKECNGADYVVIGGRDGKGAKDILSTSKLTPMELVTIAEEAWRNPSGFNCKRGVTIHGFAGCFNEIMAELRNGHVLPQQALRGGKMIKEGEKF